MSNTITIYSELSKLACGDFSEKTSLKPIYDNISKNITQLYNDLLFLLSQDRSSDQNFMVRKVGPYFARSLLENVCTALLGRIDPFRVITVSKIQENEQFNINERSAIAINWGSDILTNEKSASSLWQENLHYESIKRGLLGFYYGDLFWNKAYASALQADQQILDTYRSDTEIEKFIKRIRQNIAQLYSSLSKGVHNELIINCDTLYDDISIQDLINDSIDICATLSLLSHFIDVTICSISTTEAINQYKIIKERLDSNVRV